jgi:hypothetical protein
MQDFGNIETKIDKILESQDRGIRESEHTLENLKTLLSPLDQSLRGHALDYLFELLVRRIRQKPATDQNSIDKQQRSIIVLFRIQYAFGRVDRTLCKILGFLNIDDPNVVGNWLNCVTNEMSYAVYHYSDSLEQGTLNVLKAHLVLYSHPGSDFARAMPAFLPFVSQMNRAVDNAEFSRFERELRTSSPSVATRVQVSDQATMAGLSSAVVEAMKEAAECLRNDGPFNPKKAADLMRASIEESHRDIVKRLVVATGTPGTDLRKDGARRAYLRRVGFISEAEEKFFSAIYTLLSEEGSHQLVAPRETMLLMEQTVLGYLSLLIRRLSGFVPPQPRTFA